MSLRRHILRAVSVLTAAAMVFGAFAGSAAAKKVSHKQKVRAQLLRQVKKNPRIVQRKSFLRKAALVNFKLPVTVRLRGSNNSSPVSPVYDSINPNSATVNLGASLGNRQVSLGGTLPAEVEFNDAYDGGALGNVRVNILESTTGGLTTSSIPLLWNSNVSNPAKPWWALALDSTGEANDGCGGFTGNASLPVTAFTSNIGPPFGTFLNLTGTLQGGGVYTSGIPYFTATAYGFGGDPDYPVKDPLGILGNALKFEELLPTAGGAVASTYAYGIVEEAPGVDSLDKLKVSGEVTPFNASAVAGAAVPTLGDDVINNMGLNPDPFPIPFNDPDVTTNTSDGGTLANPVYDPLASTVAPGIQNTVLRTAPITLRVAHPGTSVQQTDDSVGVDGSQNIVIGKSGGQANLFGNIPGKKYGIDVTVSLQGRINSILRAVDSDNSGLIQGLSFPPSAFECRQAITGGVQNYFAGVRLKGDLQISPAITKDGRLRIAKAQLSSLEPTDISVAACLYLHALFAAEANSSDTVDPTVPNLPLDPLSRRQANAGTNPWGTANCQATPTEVVRAAGLGAQNLTTLSTADTTGYTTAADGSRVSVAASLNVTNVAADILIGKNQ